jgi:hypothetical protein
MKLPSKKKEYHTSTKIFNTLSPEERRKVLPQLKERDKFYILDHSGFRGTKLILLKAIHMLSETEYGGSVAGQDYLRETCGNISPRHIKTLLDELVGSGALQDTPRYMNHTDDNFERTTIYKIRFDYLTAPKRKSTPADTAARFKGRTPEQIEKLIVQKEQEIARLKDELAKSQSNRGEIALQGLLKSAPPPAEISTTRTAEFSTTPPAENSTTVLLKSAANLIASNPVSNKESNLPISVTSVDVTESHDQASPLLNSNPKPKPEVVSAITSVSVVEVWKRKREECERREIEALLNLQDGNASSPAARGEATEATVGDNTPQIATVPFNRETVEARMRAALSRPRV